MDLNRSVTSLGAATLRMFGGLGGFSRFTADSFKAMANVRTWLPLLAGQMRRLGVDSVPIALFIAVFTGIVLSLLSSYIFTGTVPLYFGLDGGREHTLEEIGGMLGVTRERVRQLRDRALKRLREGEVGRALASFAA